MKAHTQRVLRAQTVIEAVAKVYDVDEAELIGPTKQGKIAWARQVAFWVLREYGGWPLTDIGRAFGGRHHATVIHGLDLVTGRMAHSYRDRLVAESVLAFACLDVDEDELTLLEARHAHEAAQRNADRLAHLVETLEAQAEADRVVTRVAS